MSSVMARKIVGLVFGVLFGFTISWLGFVRYDTILNALLLQDFYLWEVFVSGVGVAMIGLAILKRAGARTWISRQPIAWETEPVQRDHWIGGVVFGLGWVLGGTCPGPSIARVGLLQPPGLLTLLGAWIGIELCDRLESARASARADFLDARNQQG